MFTLNKASFSGEVKNVTENNGLHFLKVYQEAFGKLPTVYTVVLPKGMTPPQKGQKISIKNALCYEKDGERRFKVLSSEQLTGANLNEHFFTGVVKAWRPVEGTRHMIIEISQDVLGKYPTAFLLFLPESQQKDLKFPLMEPGDYVIVSGAKGYEKDGQFRYKVDDLKDIGILYFKNYEKGQKDAQKLRR